MEKRYAPLFPAISADNVVDGGSDGQPPLSQTFQRSKRVQVSIACQPCRRKKGKCNGRRPTCARCEEKGLHCVYDVEQGEVSRYSALKRKHGNLKEDHEGLIELYRFLRERPEAEAREIFTRIRTSDDPLGVLKFIKEADLLLSEPSSSSSRILDPRVRKLDLDALRDSPIKVRAYPWTTVAGDGLVSSLISSFFAWDNPFFYSFVDQECFLEDMKQRDPLKAVFCSPLLVNAICAMRAFTSDHAKTFSKITGKPLTTLFFQEAKKLLELEGVKASLPTVQALEMMFTKSAYIGTDRAGMLYRSAALEMLKRLNLERRFELIQDSTPSAFREKRAISKAVWGFFNFESICAYIYLPPSIIHPPQIPRLFNDIGKESNSTRGGNVDMFGRPFTYESPQPPMIPGILDLICDVSILFHRVMQHNTKEGNKIGSKEDLEQRKLLYAQLQLWNTKLPKEFQPENNLLPQTCFLRVYIDEIAISILRPLHPDTVFGENSESAKDMCIRYCKEDLETIERSINLWPLKEYSCMTLCGLYNTALTLVPLLHDRNTHESFIRSCFLLRIIARDYPMARYVLHSLQSMAWTMKLQLPPAAQDYFDTLSVAGESLTDTPVAFVMPPIEEVRELLSDDGTDSSRAGAELGVLLAKWSSLSMD